MRSRPWRQGAGDRDRRHLTARRRHALRDDPQELDDAHLYRDASGRGVNRSGHRTRRLRLPGSPGPQGRGDTQGTIARTMLNRKDLMRVCLLQMEREGVGREAPRPSPGGAPPTTLLYTNSPPEGL
jgi:hypothetical protein